jgi:hypothetical protein
LKSFKRISSGPRLKPDKAPTEIKNITEIIIPRIILYLNFIYCSRSFLTSGFLTNNVIEIGVREPEPNILPPSFLDSSPDVR